MPARQSTSTATLVSNHDQVIADSFFFIVANKALSALYNENSNSIVFEVLMADSDKHYIRRCLDGHPDDFRHLVGRYQKPLLAYLAGRMQGRESAEEAAQEAFVRAYFGLGKLKKHGSFFSWLLGIANRVAKEQCRHTTKQRDIEDIANVEEGPQEIAEDCTLGEAIAELPDNQRQVILLRFYADCSCKDIAKQLDMPLGTVTKNLSRAYAAMRDSLCRQQKQK